MTDTVAVNEIIAGKYRVDRILGQGGMGIVLAAFHQQLEERVAIKIMLPGAATSGEAVARFLREARAAAKIQSEHVARVRDVGTLENGQPYMVMEYLEGEDLSGVIASRGAVAVEDAASYLLQACEALAEAHAIGIIHRDLKPGNLFLTHRRDGSTLVKVLDFGISKVTGSAASDSDRGMTRTSTLMGSPLYMSPEQMTSSRDVDPRADIWALGIILYELVSGRTPFEAETLPQVCAAILSQPAPSLRQHRADLPPEIDAVVQRCLEKNPAHRYASVAEFAQALSPFASRRSMVSVERISRLAGASGAITGGPVAESAPPSLGAPARTQPSAGTNFDFGKTASATGQKSRGLWLALGAALAVIAALAVVLALKFRAEPPPAAETVVPTSAATALPPAQTPTVVPEITPPPAPVPPAPPAPAASASVSPPAAAIAVAAPRPAFKAPKAPMATPTPKSTPAPPPAATPTAAPAATSKASKFGGRL